MQDRAGTEVEASLISSVDLLALLSSVLLFAGRDDGGVSLTARSIKRGMTDGRPGWYAVVWREDDSRRLVLCTR